MISKAAERSCKAPWLDQVDACIAVCLAPAVPGRALGLGNLVLFPFICKVVSDELNPRDHAVTLAPRRIQVR